VFPAAWDSFEINLWMIEEMRELVAFSFDVRKSGICACNRIRYQEFDFA
jgi:hypothetical protein